MVQIWQILPKLTVSKEFANFFGSIFMARRFPFFEIPIVSIYKTIH